MSQEPAAVVVRIARKLSVAFPALRSGERRSYPRRKSDHRQPILAELAVWLINRQSLPLLAIDAQMSILLMNDASHQLLRGTSSLSIGGGKLIFVDKKHREEINRILIKNIPSACLAIQATGALSELRVTRIPFADSRHKILLLDVQPASNGEPSQKPLQEKWGLTPAESQIAIAIFKGLSQVKIADERKSSINTVKTQVRHIFQKCGVRSQVALTRRLAEAIA